MRDKSILEIDVDDIQSHYNHENISYDDLIKFTEDKINGQSQPAKNNQQSIVNEQGFYVSQSDYIEYQIAKREVIKKTLRRKKFSNNLWLITLWLLKTVFSIVITVFVCWAFYMLCWSLQKTF